MKLLTLVLVLSSALIMSCSTQKRSQTSSATTASSGTSQQSRPSPDADGSSYEKAVVIEKTNSMDGIAAEYAWLKENYPGYKMMGQSLRNHNKKPYDVLKITTAEGKEKEIYFDISNFFGKF